MKSCILCHSKSIFCLFQKKECPLFQCKNCGVIYRTPWSNKGRYLKEITKHYEGIDPSEPVASSRRRLYKSFLLKVRYLQPGRILDIGCGFGYFLSMAKEKGWDCYGVEVSQELAKMGAQRYNLNIETTPFEKTNYPDNHFHVITLWNVLEEMMDPVKVISEVKRILSPKGILFIRTPNATFHAMAYRSRLFLSSLGLGKLIPRETYIFHIYNFSNISLQKLLKKNCFTNIRILNSAPTLGSPYKTPRGKSKVRLVKKMTSFAVQFAYFLSFWKLTLAPSLEIFAAKAYNSS